MKYLTDLPAVQDMAFCLGKEGCLFIVLCAIAERITHKPIDVLRSARELIDLNLLDYVEENPSQHLKEAFFVKDRDAVLSYLTKIDGIKTVKTHKLPKNEKRPYYIKYATDAVPPKTHFVLPNYNSLYYSNTVANGAIDSYYIVILP
jgi:hypothetical protein